MTKYEVNKPNKLMTYDEDQKILNLINTKLISLFQTLKEELKNVHHPTISTTRNNGPHSNISLYYQLKKDKTHNPQSISDFRKVSESGTSGKSGAIIKMIKGDIYHLKKTEKNVSFNGKKLPSDCQNGIEVSSHCNSLQLQPRSFTLQNNEISWKKIGSTNTLKSMNVKFINFQDKEQAIIFTNNSSNQKLYVKPNNYDQTKIDLNVKLELTDYKNYKNYVLKTWNVVLPQNKLITLQTTTGENTQCYQLHPCLMELIASRMIMEIVDKKYKKFEAQDFALPVMFDYSFQKIGSNIHVKINILMEKAQFERFFNFKNYILETEMIETKATEISSMVKKYLDNFEIMHNNFSFVHTDLKLDNIFIGTDNMSKGILKISDLDKACFSFKNEKEGTFQFFPLEGGSSSGNDNRSSRKCVIDKRELILDFKYLFTDLLLRFRQRSNKKKPQLSFIAILNKYESTFNNILSRISNTLKEKILKLDLEKELSKYVPFKSPIKQVPDYDFMSHNITRSVQIIFED